MPDRIEAGTFLCMAAITNSNIRVNNVKPNDMMAILRTLKCMGMSVTINNNSIYIKSKNSLNKVDVKTMPYPRFSN